MDEPSLDQYRYFLKDTIRQKNEFTIYLAPVGKV
jgi:hypothetical protein